MPIGLDIGTTTVRVLQLAGTAEEQRLVDAAKYVIPQEAKRDPATLREAVVEGIGSLLRSHRFRRREAVMALKPDEVAVRSIRMAKMPPEELPTAVNWEVQNKFPFDTATAVVQHLPAGEVRQGDQVLDETIVFVAPREAVDAKIALAADVGLDLVSLDAEPCAVFRSFERFLRRCGDEATVTTLVDIGAGTTVVLARGRDIVFVKTIPIGGALFNRAVAECLELAATEAEALRRRLSRRPREDGTPDPVRRAVNDCIRPHLEELAGEIALCLRYYGVTFRDAGPESITFTGGESHDPEIPRMLGERLGTKVVVGDPLRQIRTDHLGPVPDRRRSGGEWATSVGLSLKGLALDRVVGTAGAA